MVDDSRLSFEMSRITHHASRFTSHIPGLFNRIDAGIILAALLTLLIIQNLWRPGLPPAADLPIHLYRTLEYDRAWTADVIVPRWAPNLAYGYGYPLFVFAPPLPYLLGLAFHTAGLTFEAALKAVLIVTIPLYAMGMYLLVRDLLHSIEAGLVAATAYAFAPFALREALLYGGNVPQFLAIGLFPWTLWAITRAGYTRSWGWMILSAIFYAGVLLSHLFQALVFTPVVALYGLILSANSFRAGKESPLLPSPSAPQPNKRATYLPLCTIPLGLLLSAFFWIPAFVERFYTRARSEAFLEKSPFFVRYPHWTELLAWIKPLDARAANPYVPLTLGLITLSLAALGLIAGIIKPKVTKTNPNQSHRQFFDSAPFNFVQDRQDSSPISNNQSLNLTRTVTIFFALIATGAIFLTLPLSRPVWETITILQVAEFPWRMLGLANLGLAFLAGAALLLPPARFRRIFMIGCLLLQLFAIAPLLYPVIGFTQYGQPTIADQIKYERSSQSIGTTTLGEYLPNTVAQPPTTSPLVETFEANRMPERLDRSSLPAAAEATLIEQTAVTHRYRLNSPAGFTLRLFQFDYPGWHAQLDQQPVPIRPEEQTGLILIDIPTGQHTLTVQFGETPLRLVSMLLTAVTVVGLIGLAVIGTRRRGLGSNMQGLSHYPQSLAPRSPLPAPRSSLLLPLRSGFVLISLGVILATAVWLKPRLYSVFTLASPPNQALPAQYQTGIDFTPFDREEHIRLIGYDVSRKVVPPGGYLQVTLYWQTDAAPLKANLQPFVHLDRLDDFTTIADATNYTPGDVTTESVLPTFHWDNARYIRDEHDLHIPSPAPPLAYAIRVGLIDPDRDGRLLPLADASGDTAQLAIINVSPAGQPAPALAHPLNTSFSDGREAIQLTGFEFDSQNAGRLEFKLAWQTGQILATNYTVFAQLLDLDQNLVAGFDTPPLDGAYPTSTWLPDQTIIDARHIPLPHVEPGEYQLIVGLYNSDTQQRLTTPTGADFVEVARVVIDRDNEP